MGAPTFKDCVAGDIHGVFLNRMEFADTHTIDGREMDAVGDGDALLPPGTRPGAESIRMGSTGCGGCSMWQKPTMEAAHRPASA